MGQEPPGAVRRTEKLDALCREAPGDMLADVGLVALVRTALPLVLRQFQASALGNFMETATVSNQLIFVSGERTVRAKDRPTLKPIGIGARLSGRDRPAACEVCDFARHSLAAMA